jgi:hypothetical protein
MLSPARRTLRARIAAQARHHRHASTDTRRAYKALVAEEYLLALVTDEPRLTDDQRRRLARILTDGGPA